MFERFANSSLMATKVFPDCVGRQESCSFSMKFVMILVVFYACNYFRKKEINFLKEKNIFINRYKKIERHNIIFIGAFLFFV